ncbi:MAG: DUF3820 family protein [Polyangiaceae bacterium]|nr:DUF3820 family protein [Polyangiaceae bacterium]
MTNPQRPDADGVSPFGALLDQALLMELCRYRMPFGKYKDALLLRLPEAYLAWFARQGMPGGRLGMMLETALAIRANGLESLVEPLIREALGEADE